MRSIYSSLFLPVYMALKSDSDMPSRLPPTSGIRSVSVSILAKRLCNSNAESLFLIAKPANASPTLFAVKSEKLNPDLYLAS